MTYRGGYCGGGEEGVGVLPQGNILRGVVEVLLPKLFYYDLENLTPLDKGILIETQVFERHDGYCILIDTGVDSSLTRPSPF